MTRKILVTSALPYANGAIHLGHLVEYIQTDIWTRFQKMRGHECWYVCADDTHGTPIMLRAEKEGITPEATDRPRPCRALARFRRLPRRLRQLPHDAFRRDAALFRRHLRQAQGRRPDRGALDRAVLRSGQGHVPARPLHQGRVPQVRRQGPVRRRLRILRRGLCADRTEEPVLGGVRRQAGAALLRPLLLQALRPALPGVPAPRHARRLQNQPEAINKLQEWLGEPGENKLTDWDISRDAPYFGFEIPGAPGKFFYVWLDAPIGYMGSFKNLCRKRASTSTPSGARVRRPSCTTSSARTSSTSTPCSGRPNWSTPATASRPVSSPTAS
jgi:methionyl-tRNA synthetase